MLRRLIGHPVAVILIAAAAVCARVDTAWSEPIDLNLRIAWGFGPARQWRGRISIDRGTLSNIHLLGLEPESAGDILLRGRQILIEQRSPRTYDGLQVLARGETDSVLQVELLSTDEPRAKVVHVRLDSLIDGFETVDLDDQQSRLHIKRTPADALRVEFNRPHLVFYPAETWTIDIVPHWLPARVGSPQVCALSLVNARNSEEVWAHHQPITADSHGRIPPIRGLAIPIPDQEGVYNLEIRLASAGRRITPPFKSERTNLRRRVQFVVVANEPLSADPAEPTADRVVLEFDPAQPRWWERLTRLHQWKLLPGIRSDGPLGNHKPERWKHDGRDWTRLRESGWQAYPLPIDEIGAAHEVEIEFPGNVSQTTIFSIIEPNPSGKVLPIGLDSGIDIADEDVSGIAARPASVSRHRLTFWPRTRSPLLLIANLRDDRPSVFGTVRLVRRAARAGPSSPSRHRRQVMAYLHRPLIAKNFSAAEAVDEESGRSLEDWITFHDASVRLVDYLREFGFDGLAISVFADGSTLYPSQLLQPTAKLDRGIYFTDGRDAVRKDVLELLFRVCDRAGINLVPVVEFNSPLPALEHIVQTGGSEAEGIRLLNSRGESGATEGTYPDRVPLYNPLDSRVREAMLDVLREIATRYGQHPSFGGIHLAMTPQTYTHLPDVDWGLDGRTTRRFERESGFTPAQIPLAQLLVDAPDRSNDTRGRWLSWRCQQMADFYGRVQSEVASSAPGSSLHLGMAELVEAEPLRRTFQPRLLASRDISSSMHELALDLDMLAKIPNSVVPRPYRIGPVMSLSDQGPDIELNRSDELDDYFGRLSHAATQFYHLPQRLRLPALDEASPFGRENTFASFAAPVSPADFANRQRFAHSLATHDPQTIIEGGWLLPLGQEASIATFLSAFRELPAAPFVTFNGPPERTKPLTIRSLSHQGQTYLYVVNDSPWQIGAQVRIEARAKSRLQPIGLCTTEPPESLGKASVWHLNLQAYELIAATIDDPAARIVDVVRTLPPDVIPALDRRIASLNARARFLSNPPPFTSILNPEFEEINEAMQPIGWHVTKSGEQAEVTVVQPGWNSPHALSIANRTGTVSVRSEYFDPPPLRQVAVAFHVQSLPNSPPPIVKISIESDAGLEIAWPALGDRSSGPSISAEWAEIVLPLTPLKFGNSPVALQIDLVGAGNVRMDGIRLFDTLRLRPAEQRALVEQNALADYKRRHLFLGECLSALHGYWPRYLMEYVPEAPSLPAEMTQRPKSERKPERTSSRSQRVKQFLRDLPKR
jgi:hypothetical protein